MNSNSQTVPVAPQMQEVLCKLLALSPQAQDAVLTMWGSFIDGMAAQERLMSERPSA